MRLLMQAQPTYFVSGVLYYIVNFFFFFFEIKSATFTYSESVIRNIVDFLYMLIWCPTVVHQHLLA